MVIPKPLCMYGGKLKKWEENEREKRWKAVENAKYSKMLMKSYNTNRTEELLNCNRKDLRVLIGMLTGHSCLNKYLSRIGKRDTDRCRLCAQEPEDILHILTYCPNLRTQQLRMKIFHKSFLSTEDLGGATVRQLLSFAKESIIYNSFFNEVTTVG